MKKKIILGIVAGVGLLVLILGIFAFVEYRKWTTAWGTDEDTFYINIEKGWTARTIANSLYEKGAIPNTAGFLMMADLRGFATKLRAGEYEINGASSPIEIVNMIAIGYAYRHNVVVPEGFTQLQIAERCDKLGVCSKEDFLQQCRSENYFQFVIAQAPENANASVEGILFPDTYELEKNTPPEKITNKMVRRFEQVFNKIKTKATEDKEKTWWWMDDQYGSTQQIHRVIVLASLVEREAKRPEDRPLVASVFVNRLKKNMPMQADSTIHYALNDWSRPLTKKDLELDSPYNTYKNNGLPPAAICNPGKAALEAALTPPDTTYLYFISFPNGETKFTSTYDEFLKLKQQLKQGA